MDTLIDLLLMCEQSRELQQLVGAHVYSLATRNYHTCRAHGRWQCVIEHDMHVWAEHTTKMAIVDKLLLHVQSNAIYEPTDHAAAAADGEEIN